MCVEDLGAPIAFSELKDGDLAVGGGTGEEAAEFVGGPGDEVDGGGVLGEGGYQGPLRVGLAPDEDAGVVG